MKRNSFSNWKYILGIILLLIGICVIIKIASNNTITDANTSSKELSHIIETSSTPTSISTNNSLSSNLEIMGFSAYYEEIEEPDGFVIRNYYTKQSSNEESKLIAISWNCTIDDYIKDINQDGTSELVCNCIYGGDGHKEVIVYRWNGSQIEKGMVDWENLALDNLDYWGINAVQTEYNSSYNKIMVYYTQSINSQRNIAIREVEFDALVFSVWDGE